MTEQERIQFHNLLGIPTSNLSDEDVAIKGKLISQASSDDYPDDEVESRFIIGNYSNGVFDPYSSDFEKFEVPENLLLANYEGICWAQLSCDKFGQWTGDINSLSTT